MSYSQHEWTNGETITAAKMNNIEEGIAEAAQSGGGGVAWVRINFVNMSNVSHGAGHVCYAREWSASGEGYEAFQPCYESFSFGNNPILIPMTIPEENSGIYMIYVWAGDVGASGYSFSATGDISDDPVDVWLPADSATYQGYLISGSCTITVTYND